MVYSKKIKISKSKFFYINNLNFKDRGFHNNLILYIELEGYITVDLYFIILYYEPNKEADLVLFRLAYDI